MAETFTWLHFTDLHFGLRGQRFLWPRLKHDLFKDLRRLVTATGGFDVVFFTGDFVQTGAAEEYSSLNRELEELWEELRKMGTSPILCPVPGNHDLRRPGPSAATHSLRHWWNDPDIQESFWRDPKYDARRAVDSCFANYEDWISKLQVPTNFGTRGLLPGDFSVSIEKNGFKLGIVGMNTTFLQLEPGDFERKLDLNVSQLLSVTSQNPDKWIKEHTLAILLTHHPIGWLHPEAERHFRDQIYPPGRFHAHFSGHLHIPSQYDLSEGGAAPRRMRQGPSLYGLESYSGANSAESRVHGYNAGRIEIELGRGLERIWPRIALRSLSGEIRLCPDQRYDLTDECVTSQFEVELPEAETADNRPDEIEAVESTIMVENTTAVTPSLFDNQPNDSSLKDNLKACARFQISPLPQHSAIRLDEQSQFEHFLRQKRMAWIVADWGSGLTGFLSSALARFSKKVSDLQVFHIRCQDATDPDAFEMLFLQQCGMPLQRFCNSLANVDDAFLLLEGINPGLCSGEPLAQLLRIVSAVVDYCPNLRVILTSRVSPQKAPNSVLRLLGLEPPEVRIYLMHHPDANADLCEADVIERIHERSDGLPMHIDRILKSLVVSSIEAVLGAELEGTNRVGLMSDQVPKVIVETISALRGSTDKRTLRSFRMLQVLSVLPYGETIETLHHFLPTEPFFFDNALQLIELNLLEAIPLHISAPKISGGHLVSSSTAPKLLKVHRQIRDYVLSLISEKERDEIVRAGADHFFSKKWKENKIKLRVLPLAYKEYFTSGLGNEFAIIHHLLQAGCHSGEPSELRKAARLAVHYSRELRARDRFRDLEIVLSGIMPLISEQSVPAEWVELASMYGMALRMMKKQAEALRYLRHVLDVAEEHADKRLKGSIFLNIAFAEERMDNTEAAVDAAKQVLRYADENSPAHLQAKALIEGNSGPVGTRASRLRKLEENGRSSGKIGAANSIALDVASETKNQEEKIKLLDSVLRSGDPDEYNRSRAIVGKALAVLGSPSNDGVGLNILDRVMLSSAYSYLHGQRFGKLFDRAHDAMWQVLEEVGDLNQLLKLFRHSSFIWRIRGEDKKEAEYATRLKALKPPEEAPVQGNTLLIELRYFWRRAKVVLAAVTNKRVTR